MELCFHPCLAQGPFAVCQRIPDDLFSGNRGNVAERPGGLHSGEGQRFLNHFRKLECMSAYDFAVLVGLLRALRHAFSEVVGCHTDYGQRGAKFVRDPENKLRLHLCQGACPLCRNSQHENSQGKDEYHATAQEQVSAPKRCYSLVERTLPVSDQHLPRSFWLNAQCWFGGAAIRRSSSQDFGQAIHVCQQRTL